MPDLTADDISEYLATQDDFDLELFAYRELLQRGIQGEHGGTYIDALTGKPRQFDVRASMHILDTPWVLNLALECKSLSKEAPLVISRVPRPPTEAVHQVIRSWGRHEMGERFYSVVRSPARLPLYGADHLVGKHTFQLRKEVKGRGAEISFAFKKVDGEAYDKWSQALSSAAKLVELGAQSNVAYTLECAYTLVLPALIVSNETLWAIDYDETGTMTVPPHQVDNCELYVGREYSLPLDPSFAYEITHLHIFTRTGFVNFLNGLRAPSSMQLERMFGFTLRQQP